jgi:predicted polyphosphate/ATP-dependent NAD kinase
VLLALIVNPVAGLGGRVGLKGSDGRETQARARELGATPTSPQRAAEALRRLDSLRGSLQILTYSGEMGEDSARAAGFAPIIVGSITPGATTADDTLAAAQEAQRRGADLLLFAGGDGTARDIVRAIGYTLPALGIPAGVKIFSAAFAIHPTAAGDLAREFLTGGSPLVREAEVLDLDEDAYRAGHVAPRLYGYLKIPYRRRLIQGRKAPSPLDERGTLEAIAQDILDQMETGVAYIIGPGTSTRPILGRLGLEKTLVGVDVLLDRRLLRADANEAALLHILHEHPARVVVTPIGGQGVLFGRGNQPISPTVLQAVGREGILVVSTPEKIHALRGRPLLVDSGDPEVDRWLTGYIRIITGYHERAVYPVST